MRKISHDDFIKRVAEISPNITILSNYMGMHSKIECVCEAGHHWTAIAQDLVRGTGCPKCAAIKRGKKRAKTHKQFVEELYAINPSVSVIGTYKNAKTKIELRCKEGHKWITLPDTALRGSECLTCCNIQSSLKQRKSHEQFAEEVHNLQPDIVVLGKYVNSTTKIEFMCSKGHKWKTAPYNILSGCSCPNCKAEKASAEKTKTHEQFIQELSDVNPDVTILGTYQKAKIHLLCRCDKCNNEWKVTPDNLLHGYGCPKCIVSKGEKAVEEHLREIGVSFETQKRFVDCIDTRPLPFDFYLPDYNLCIEYQGEQHYKATRRMGDEEALIYRQKHDSIKREYCKSNGIHLLEIPYTQFKHIPDVLDNAIREIGGDGSWVNQSA